MNVNLLHVFLADFLILLSCKATQSLIIDENPERIIPNNQNIDPQIELQILDKERVIDVGLHDADLTIYQLHIFEQFYSFSLGHCFRFIDIVLVFLCFVQLLIVAKELGIVVWNTPSEWEKVISIRKLSVHLHEAPTQKILLSQHIDSRIMANFLVFVELEKIMGLNV